MQSFFSLTKKTSSDNFTGTVSPIQRGEFIRILKFFKRPLVAVLVALLIPVYFLACHQMDHYYRIMDGIYYGEKVSGVRARIQKKEIKNDSFRYTVKVLDDGVLSGQRGIISSEDYDLHIDSVIAFDGECIPFSQTENEGSFDAKKYYASKGITFFVKTDLVHEIDRGFFGYEVLFDIRSRIGDHYAATLPGEEAGRMTAMAFGDKSILDVETKELFSDAGLAHLLAVSGLHISIVGIGLYRLLRKRGAGYGLAGALSFAVVGCYGIMTGYSTSTFRAVLMFLIMTVGEILGEAYDVGSAAALSAMVLLIGSPVALFDSGAIFSFGAVFGIVYVADRMKKSYLNIRRGRFGDLAAPPVMSTLERLISSMIFGLGLQLSVLPIVATSYHAFCPYVIITNLLLLPFMGLLIGWGLLAGVFGAGLDGVLMATTGGFINGAFAGGSATVLPTSIGRFFMLPCHIILYVYEMVSDLMLKLPRSTVAVGQPKAWQIIFYYGLLFLGVHALEHLSLKPFRIPIYKRLLPAALFVLSFIVLAFPISRETEIDMLSVGQGDGLCIISKEGEVFMVDGGSSNESELGRYTLKPFLLYKGIDHVSFWFVTHMDADHYSGLMEILESGYEVDNIVLAKSVEKNEAYYQLIRLCDDAGTEVVYMENGDSCGTESLSFTCLFPDYPSGFSGTNENSLCMRLDYGEFNMIFTGDMGEEQEKCVLSAGTIKSDAAESGAIEILKSAHHGSKNSNCYEWLEAIDPELCIISAGRHNRYHHPSPDTIARLDELQIPHLCTIDTGQIKILPEPDGRFLVETFIK